MAGIIKARTNHASAEEAPLKAFAFEDVGQAYVNRVRAEATKIITDARREAEKIKAQALEDGRQAAIQAVETSLRTKLDQQLGQALAAVRQAVERINESRRAWQRHGEENLVQLAAAIAARLCRKEVMRSPELTLKWVREALALAGGSASLTLRLNPQDHALLAEQIALLARSVSALGPLEIVADSSITAGGCRLDTEFGAIDQQIEAQVARIAEDLLD